MRFFNEEQQEGLRRKEGKVSYFVRSFRRYFKALGSGKFPYSLGSKVSGFGKFPISFVRSVDILRLLVPASFLIRSVLRLVGLASFLFRSFVL